MEHETTPPWRQSAALLALTSRVDAHPGILGAVLVGSMVAGETDALSDLDCIVVFVSNQNAFCDVWSDRCFLHEETATTCWDYFDEHGPTDAGAHKWLDSTLVLVECLITTPDSGVRLAPPHRVVAGPADVAAYLEPRPPVERSDMRGAGNDLTRDLDVETAYDILKQVVRRHRQHQ